MEDNSDKSKRNYSPEFKESLVETALRRERSIGQLAKDFGVPKGTLFGWVRERGWKGKSGRPAAPPQPANDMERELLALRARNAELERKVRGLEEDREILKKATAFFAKHHQ